MPARKSVSLDQAAPRRGPLHLAIGMFDGVHLGHQAVIEAAMHSARQDGGQSAVLTFHPHPSRLFRPAAPTLLMMPPEQKTAFLYDFGVDLVIAQPFTRQFSRVRAEAFLPYLKKKLPALAAVYVGENFRFGQGRAGDVALLIQSGREAGLSVVSVARLRHNGQPISSTRIRGLLAGGDIADASHILGYNYFCDGVVIRGRRLGQKLGFPTLNLAWAPEARPQYGVYAMRVRPAGGGPARDGVANYGVRPTVTGGRKVAPLLEIHLLRGANFPRPGARLHVEWLEFLRPERKFSSLAALRRQIARDCAAAKKFFAQRKTRKTRS